MALFHYRRVAVLAGMSVLEIKDAESLLLPVRYICLSLHIKCLQQLHQLWDNPYLATYKLYAIPNNRLNNFITVG